MLSYPAALRLSRQTVTYVTGSSAVTAGRLARAGDLFVRGECQSGVERVLPGGLHDQVAERPALAVDGKYRRLMARHAWIPVERELASPGFSSGTEAGAARLM